MKCENAAPRLEALLDRELPFLNRTRIRYHANRCSTCSREIAALKRINELMLEGDMFPAVTAFREDSPVSSVQWKRAAVAGAAGIAVLLLLLIPGNVVKPAVAFADVERAMQNVRTATWRETWSDYLDGKKQWTVVTEHWVRLHPPAHATRDIAELRSGPISIPHDRTLFDESGFMRYNARGNKYTFLRTNLAPGTELQERVRKIILLQIAAPTSQHPQEAPDPRVEISPWVSDRQSLGGRQYIRFRQTVSERKAKLGYTPAGRVAPAVRTLWVDPSTRLVARAEHHLRDPWTPGYETVKISDGFRYDVEPPPGTFDLTPPTGVTATVVDWRQTQITLSKEEQTQIQRVIDYSESAWIKGDFEKFSQVWDFAYLRPIPNTEQTYRSEAWARKVWKWWVSQHGRWRSWSSRVEPQATSTRSGGWEGAYVPEGDPDLIEVKTITRAVEAHNPKVRAWDTRYFLRRVGDDYRITHWRYRWPFSPNIRERHKARFKHQIRSR